MVWFLHRLALEWLSEMIEGSDEVAAKRQEGLHFLSAVIIRYLADDISSDLNRFTQHGGRFMTRDAEAGEDQCQTTTKKPFGDS